MKKLFLIFVGALCLIAMFVSCNKNENDVAAVDDVNIDSPVKAEAKNVDVSGLNKDAVAYYSNIKTAIFATGSNLPETIKISKV
ncbi:MAG: hypothetical protein LBG15_12675 [Dysgonamonadaceae bacterium]|jgi:hypothetical protein|nr:hypothetical protein [Dysgonamonadaceae bacterium]